MGAPVARSKVRIAPHKVMAQMGPSALLAQAAKPNGISSIAEPSAIVCDKLSDSTSKMRSALLKVSVLISVIQLQIEDAEGPLIKSVAQLMKCYAS